MINITNLLLVNECSTSFKKLKITIAAKLLYYPLSAAEIIYDYVFL